MTPQPHSLLPARTASLSLLRSVYRLGGPVTVQALLSSMLGFVDTLMVSGLGAAALAGVGIANRLWFVATMALGGIAGATGILVAQYSGAGRAREADGLVRLSLMLGLALTLPISLVLLFGAPALANWLSSDNDVAAQAGRFLLFGAAFLPLASTSATLGAALRGHGDTRTPMWAGMAALALNALLNFLFISGRFGLPAGGVAAAALASTVAKVLEIGILARQMHPVNGETDHLKGLALVLRSALPLAAKEVCWAGGIFASSLVISRMGKRPLAAFNLVAPVEGMLISLFIGCGAATGILLGHALGRHSFDEAYDIAVRLRRTVPFIALQAGFMLAGLTQVLRHSRLLEGWIDPGLHDMALDTLTIMCLGMGARTHNMMASMGILRSGNDVAWLMLVDLCSMWVVNVPMVAFAALVLHWPLPAVAAVMLLEEVLKVAVFRHRIRSGKWMSSVVPAGAP